MARVITPEQARLRMASLCARAEQCSHDIRAKLQRLGMTEEDTAAIMQFLTDNKFLDDARYARSLARDKTRFAGWGAMKIKAALAAKRIPASVIKEAVALIETQDADAALMRAARAKARSLDLGDRADCQKLLRHLASRGFSAADSCRALDRLRNKNKN